MSVLSHERHHPGTGPRRLSAYIDALCVVRQPVRQVPSVCTRKGEGGLTCACRMFTPETGGQLNKVFHFYAYEDLAERESIRQEMVDRDKWLRFLDKSRPHVLGPQVRPTPAHSFVPGTSTAS